MARINPGLMMIDGGGDTAPFVSVIAQAVASSPAVVNTPANVAPSATEALKVAEAVAAAVAPIYDLGDMSDYILSSIVKNTTKAVITNPEVIATPAGQTVNTTTLQGIIDAAIKMPYDSTNPATTTTLPYSGTTTPSVKNLDTITLDRDVANTKTSASPATGVTTASPILDPTKTAYADLTPAQRATMSQDEKMDYIEAARTSSMAADAKARAASNPMFNFAVRPTAPTKAGAIQYYSWIGDTNTGSWKLYSAPDTPENQAKYGERSTGGVTQATPESPIGANTVVTPVTTPITSTAATVAVIPSVVPVTPAVTSVVTSPASVTVNVASTTDPETLALIQSLQSQISYMTKMNEIATNKAYDTAAATAAQTAAEKATARKNAIDVLTERFQRYGLGSLVNKIKDLAIDGATEATITLGLQETDEYKTRFKANQARIAKGLSVLNPAEYLSIEDGYRQVLRSYGLKQFDTDEYVSQFIANDVSAAELSNRVVTAVQRVQNADPAISRQLRDFYGIGQEDLVAYVLDPNQQFQKIQRQVAAAEIGVAAARQGLQAGVSTAEQLAAQGVTEAEAQKGYATIADILPTAEKLSNIYSTTLDTYGQSEAEQEVFNSLASAQRKRQKLTAREVAAFSGSAGTNKTSLIRPTIGQY
jgi:hypothetical protein